MDQWTQRVLHAVEEVGTPCYVGAWAPVGAALVQLDAIDSPVPVRSWLSFKTHPLEILAAEWLRSGRGVEVVSEKELATMLGLGATVDQVLVNGVAKQAWLGRYPIPRLRVHFDSTSELDALLPAALEQRWRVGLRVHAPDECDARDPRFGGQFGMSPEEAIGALRRLRSAGVGVESIHFHLGQRRQQPGAYVRALDRCADVCDAANVAPMFVDCGGGLPTEDEAASAAALEDLAGATRRAPVRFPALREIWIENGRFVTETSTALAVRVIDVKERDDCRYLICDGGRTNHALAADAHPHPLLLIPERAGARRLTTVCGPTCMTDDRLGRWMLPAAIEAGDLIVWLDAGAYHLPWETRFSHGLCAVVWFDQHDRPAIARPREQVSALFSEACHEPV